MDTDGVIQSISLIILVILSAFFSASETALTTVNNVRLLELSAEGNRRAKRTLELLDKPGKMLSTILIANNIVNISASALATTLAMKIWGSRMVAAATGILTLVILIFGEITPKTLASIYSLNFSLAMGGIILALRRILTPIIVIVDFLANGMLKLLSVDASSARQSMTEYEFRHLVEAGNVDGVLENEEKDMIYNVVDFGDSLARDIMIPRIEMSSISIDSSFEELKMMFLTEKYTRIPVYEGSNDNVVGVINIKDIVFCSDDDFKIRDYMREPAFTFEYKKTSELLAEMREKSLSIIFVLDEYGATVGLITMEDLLEEIVGEIRDEYDEGEKELIRGLGDHEYIVPGSMKLDDINDAIGSEFESEDYDSIGGLFLERLDRLPEAGEQIELDDGTELQVMEMDRNKIVEVKISIPLLEE